ncbi:MAG: hypothetical protein WCV70_01575 [Patescibacteria group bacterium]|jgi:hypothetical protein
MKNIFKISIILLLLINVFAIGILTVNAESLLDKTKYSEGCIDSGNCQLNDFTRIAVSISGIILGIVGSLSLLAFVAGGLMMMLSGGKAEMVARGKQTLIGAVIGLAIVFTSYTIIYFIFKSLGITGSNWFTSGWFK